MKDSLYWFKPCKREKLLQFTSDAPVIEPKNVQKVEHLKVNDVEQKPVAKSTLRQEADKVRGYFLYENGILTIPVYDGYFINKLEIKNGEIYVEWLRSNGEDKWDYINLDNSHGLSANTIIKTKFDGERYLRDIVLDLNDCYKWVNYRVVPLGDINALVFSGLDSEKFNTEGMYEYLAQTWHIFRTKATAIQALPKDIIIKVPATQWDSLAYEAQGYSVVEMEYVSKDNHLLIHMHKQ